MLPVSLQPTPLVVDTHLRTPPDCKLVQNGIKRTMPHPVILHGSKVTDEEADKVALLRDKGVTTVAGRTKGELSSEVRKDFETGAVKQGNRHYF